MGNNLPQAGEKVAVTMMVASKIEAMTSKGSPYISGTLIKRNQKIPFKMWDTTSEQFPTEGTIIKAIATVDNFNGTLSFILSSVTKAEGENLDDYVPCAPVSSENIEKTFFSVFKEIKDKDALDFCREWWMNYGKKVIVAPYSSSILNCKGGLGYFLTRVIEVIRLQKFTDVDFTIAALLAVHTAHCCRAFTESYSAKELTSEQELLGVGMFSLVRINEWKVPSNGVGSWRNNASFVNHIRHILNSYGDELKCATPEAFSICFSKKLIENSERARELLSSGQSSENGVLYSGKNKYFSFEKEESVSESAKLA